MSTKRCVIQVLALCLVLPLCEVASATNVSLVIDARNPVPSVFTGSGAGGLPPLFDPDLPVVDVGPGHATIAMSIDHGLFGVLVGTRVVHLFEPDGTGLTDIIVLQAFDPILGPPPVFDRQLIFISFFSDPFSDPLPSSVIPAVPVNVVGAVDGFNNLTEAFAHEPDTLQITVVSDTRSANQISVPAPASFGLLTVGLAALGVRRARRRRRPA